MVKTITFGIQKGGAGKTTTAGVTAYVLARQYKVLAVDMDSQGNLTEMLTQQDIYSFHKKTVLEAMQNGSVKGFVHRLTENLDIVTAEDFLATFPRWLYTEYRGGNRSMALRNALAPVRNDYDYIIIDTPPALGDQTINALAASDAVVVMFEPSKFCYSALERFLETVLHIQEKVHAGLKLAGILCTLIDARRSDSKALVELVEEEYPELVFKTIIRRRAIIGRLSIQGLLENPEINQVIHEHKEFLKELVERV